MTELVLPGVGPLDSVSAARAQHELDRKTKPRRSLGRLEDLAVQLAAVRGGAGVDVLDAAVVVAAGDHGYARHDVSAFPQEVTAQMLSNFAAGGAAVSVLARHAGARLVVVDVAVAGATTVPGVRRLAIAPGTRDATEGPAMTLDEARTAIAAGCDLAAELAKSGVAIVAVGEMGIANTTAASALTAALLDVEPRAVLGRGTGVDNAALARKLDAIQRALAANDVSAAAPFTALAAVGGIEIAFLVGVIVGAAAARMVVVLDGFVVGSAALAAYLLEPQVVDYCVAAHISPEPGHRLILDRLSLTPLIDWDLRLGEGTGAVSVLPLLRQAAAVLCEMATFEGAGVSAALK